MSLFHISVFLVLIYRVHLKTKFSPNQLAHPHIDVLCEFKLYSMPPDFNLSFNLESLYKQLLGPQMELAAAFSISPLPLPLPTGNNPHVELCKTVNSGVVYVLFTHGVVNVISSVYFL